MLFNKKIKSFYTNYSLEPLFSFCNLLHNLQPTYILQVVRWDPKQQTQLVTSPLKPAVSQLVKQSTIN